MQGSTTPNVLSSNLPRRNVGRRDAFGSYSDSDESVRFHSLPINRENGNKLALSNMSAQRSTGRNPKALPSVAEHPTPPKLGRQDFKSVSSKSMEYTQSPTRTATQHRNIYVHAPAPVPASPSMYTASSPASLPSLIPHHSPYLFRPGPPTIDDPDVGCGQASLTLFSCLFNSLKRSASTGDSPKDRRALKKKARRVPIADAFVEKPSKRPNRRGYYRFTDEEMEEQNATREQLMSWRENRVRSHILQGHEGQMYQGAQQMRSQGVPVTFLIPPQ